MIILQEKAYAKLNLTLDIVGKRDDGYHDLSMIMQAISLCDELELKLGTKEPWQVTCDWEHIPHGRKNLCYKAAKAYYEASGTDPDGLSIHITKRIPDQAGLGGGSADAAAVLRALNTYENNRFSMEELEKIGLSIGSDVPFCVGNRTCLATGRGEVMTPITPMPTCYYVLIKPPFSVSTPELFAKVEEAEAPVHPNQEKMIEALKEGDLRSIGGKMLNVFEFILLKEHKELYELENALENCGALGTSMTGSGPVMFGIFEHFDFAATASMSLMETGYQTFLATNYELDV